MFEHDSDVAQQRLLMALNQSEDPQHIEQCCQQLFAQFGHQAKLQLPFFCNDGRRVFIGKRVVIRQHCMFNDFAAITLSDDVLICERVQLCTTEGKGIYIGPAACISHDVTIMPGVNIGANAVISAGCVVDQDVAENAVCYPNAVLALKGQMRYYQPKTDNKLAQ